LDGHYNLKIADFGYASAKSTNTTEVGTEDYMAPELFVNSEYNGQVADLFGAGIILFMMVAQSKAFLKATASDNFYKNILCNKPEKFWKIHSHSISYSSDFKNLVTSLLASNPIHRPSISEIKEHPWFTKSVPTKDEIKEEFARRKEDLEAEQKRQKDEDLTQHEFDVSVFEINTVSRGIGGDDEETKVDVEREVMEYIPECKRYTQFFSTSELKDLWTTLAAYISNVTSDYKFSADDYSVTAKLVKESSGKSDSKDIISLPIH
jgi:serine/threonine protein kinase